MNGDRLIQDAKNVVLQMSKNYRQPQPRKDILLTGRAGFAYLQAGIYLMKEAGYISEYDAKIGEKIAWIMTGGDLDGARARGRAIPAGHGTRSIPVAAGRTQNTGTNPAHAENRQAPPELRGSPEELRLKVVIRTVNGNLDDFGLRISDCGRKHEPNSFSGGDSIVHIGGDLMKKYS